MNGVVEIGGPEQFRFDDPIRRVLAAMNDPREVVTDPARATTGSPSPSARSCPGTAPDSGKRDSIDWLRQTAGMKTAVA